MKNYSEQFRVLISEASNIILAKEVLKELASDIPTLRELIGDSLNIISRNEIDRTKIFENNLFLSSLAHELSRDIYAPFLSFHSADFDTTSLVNHSIFCAFSPVNSVMHADRYLLPQDWNCDVFDPTVRAVFDGTIKINPGDVFEIRPDNICYHFKFYEPTAILKIQSIQKFRRFEWSFDANTGLAWQQIAVQPKDSYVEHLCMAARSLNDNRLIAPLEHLLTYPTHNIRWSAAQALGSMSKELGVDALRHLAADLHPQIAETAKSILQRI